MNVLLLETDITAAPVGDAIAGTAGITAVHAATAAAALTAVQGGGFDVAVLDLDMPGLDGCEMVRRMRAADINVPVIVLSGDARAEVKVRAFAVGADDFINVPFDRDEMIARLHAVARRGKGISRTSMRAGRMELLPESQELLVDGRPVQVTEKEFAILELLMLRRGTTLAKEAFLAHLYSGMDVPSAKIIDVFICKLRRKLSQAGAPDAIETVWGQGYMVRDTPVPHASAPRQATAGPLARRVPLDSALAAHAAG